MDGPCSTNGGEEELILAIDGEVRGKKPLGRPKGSWDGYWRERIG
jgi:hypothetical protein